MRGICLFKVNDYPIRTVLFNNEGNRYWLDGLQLLTELTELTERSCTPSHHIPWNACLQHSRWTLIYLENVILKLFLGGGGLLMYYIYISDISHLAFL